MMWWEGRIVGFDLETTSPDPQEARIVTAAVAQCGGGEPTDTATWLADPGVPIPDEAAEVHGITTERAQAEGRPIAEVVDELVTYLAGCALGRPLAVCNSRFDLTVAARACERHGIEPLHERIPLLMVDPRVIDPFLDRYRRSYPSGVTPEQAKERGIPSSRTLTGMCLHYNVALDGAHDAAFDAIAAARLAYRLGSSGQVVRRVRGRSDAIELANLRREWESVRCDLGRLHSWQVGVALAERDRFAAYKESIGEHEEAARIRAEVGWPVLEPLASTASGPLTD